MSTRPAQTFREIGLRPVQWKAVERRATRAGQTAADYVRALVEQDLRAGRVFDEILKPFRRDVSRAGITERQLDEIVDRARRGKGRTRAAAPRAKRR